MAKLDDKKKCKKFPFADVLKWAIFSLVMLAPFFAVLARVAYVTFNKNAKDSYSNYSIETAVNLDSSNFNDLYVNGQYITFTNSLKNTQWNSGQYGFDNISLDLNQIFGTTGLTYKSFSLYSSNYNISFIDENNNAHVLQNYQTPFSYYVNKNNGNEEYLYNYGIVTILTFTSGTLDNAFTYAVNQINEQPIFNWTQNTAMYTVIDSMTSDLEINTNGNILATLLTYWTLNTAVYLIFDVVIHFSTKLVHMFSGE